MPKITKQGRRNENDALDRTKPLGDLFQNTGYKINIYGRSGTGKTRLAGTFPKPLLHIVCSGMGLEESRSLVGMTGIDDVELNDSDDLTSLIDYIAKGGKSHWNKKGKTWSQLKQATGLPYQTVVLDHGTGLQDLYLREILGLDKLPEQKSWGLASRGQYGQCALKTKEALRAILGLPIHIVILAQERKFNSDEEDVEIDSLLAPYVMAAFTPSVVGWLNPVCSYIGHTFIRPVVKEKKAIVAGKAVSLKERTKEVEFCLRTGPHPIYTVKFRLPKGSNLPEVIVNPTFEKIHQLITQGG